MDVRCQHVYTNLYHDLEILSCRLFEFGIMSTENAPFRRFTYVTAHSSTFQLHHLRHSSFTNPSFTSPTSQALHLRHLANRPCISTLVTKFSQNIVADTDKNKILIDCHKCSSSFLSIDKSYPLKIPASAMEKVRSGRCLKLFLIDCSSLSQNMVF